MYSPAGALQIADAPASYTPRLDACEPLEELLQTFATAKGSARFISLKVTRIVYARCCSAIQGESAPPCSSLLVGASIEPTSTLVASSAS